MAVQEERESRDYPQDVQPARHLKPAPGLALHFVPDLIKMAAEDAAPAVRAAARHALHEITGIPRDNAYNATPAQQQSWLPLWQAETGPQ